MNKRTFLCAAVAVASLGHAAALRAQPVAVDAVVRHYAALVHATYSDTLALARQLQRAVQALTRQPSAAGLQQARTAWLAAREVYGQTEAFRFYAGPIDDRKGLEQRLNTWPVDESYIDEVPGRPGSGLINNRRVPLTAATLVAYNLRGGLENIATGWHAIEFLLWGQDLSETGPGDRNYQDYVDGAAKNADRRRQYLRVVTTLLVADLQSLVNAWEIAGQYPPGRRSERTEGRTHYRAHYSTNYSTNYRTSFERGGLESVRKIIVGLGVLSRAELSGERMEVALNTKDQEDEQSCFSDNTHRDIVNNALGIENVWLGRYQRPGGSTLQGPSLRELVAARDAAMAEGITQQVARSVAAARAIQAPFDREILGRSDAPGVQRVQATIDSVRAQARLFAEAASVLGITQLNMPQTKAVSLPPSHEGGR